MILHVFIKRYFVNSLYTFYVNDAGKFGNLSFQEICEFQISKLDLFEL